MSEAYDLVRAYEERAAADAALRKSFDDPLHRPLQEPSFGRNEKIKSAGWREDEDFFSKDSGLYVKGGKATLVYRSTNIENPHDLAADLNIAMGRESSSKRFKIAEDVFQRAEAKYGKGNVDVAGFSLGGSQAMYISDKYGAKANVFNPGVSPADVENNNRQPKNYKNVNAYVTAGDAISNSAYTMNGLKTTPIYAGEVYKGVAKDFGPSAAEKATKAPLTTYSLGERVLKGAAELAFPESIPFVEAGSHLFKSLYGIGTLIKHVTHAHSLDSMDGYFQAHQKKNEPVAPQPKATPVAPQPKATPKAAPKAPLPPVKTEPAPYVYQAPDISVDYGTGEENQLPSHHPMANPGYQAPDISV